MGRRAVRLLFSLVTGNCDVLERAPVLLVPLQRQLLGSVNYRTGNHLKKGEEGRVPSCREGIEFAAPSGVV